MIWQRNDDTFTATVEAPAGGARFFLTVERLPLNSWDWTVWQAGRPGRLVHYGVAPTAREAMRDAEVAAAGNQAFP
jgi:hypothetical protein